MYTHTCSLAISFSLTMLPRVQRYTLFPYTTLFRSKRNGYDDLSDLTKLYPRTNRDLWEKIGVPKGSVGGSIDRKSTRLNSSHVAISYAVFCLKKKKNKHRPKQSDT